MNNYPTIKLDGTQERQWSETLAACNWVAPGFVHILYTMLMPTRDAPVAHFTEQLPATAATDGARIFLKPSDFFKLPLMKRVFAVNHEILHCILAHCDAAYVAKQREGIVTPAGKTIDYDQEDVNIYQDYVINDMLVESNIGQIDPGWLHDKKVGTHADSWADVYAKHHKKKPKGKKGGGGNGPGTGRFDMHMDPGTSSGTPPAAAAAGHNQQAWQQAIAGAQAVAKAQGKLPAAIEALFNGFLEPVVDWTEHIRGLVSRKVGSGGYDFRKPDRRMLVRDIVVPGRTGHGAGLVVIGMDSSGSIYADPTLIDRWMGELTGIMEDVRPKEVHIVWCDAEVQRVDELNDASDIDEVRMKGAKGGGGTAFEPVFDYIAEQDIVPDVLLYLTDGDGSFPAEAPRYAVIWGNITPGYDTGHYPFGDVVTIPVTS